MSCSQCLHTQGVVLAPSNAAFRRQLTRFPRSPEFASNRIVLQTSVHQLSESPCSSHSETHTHGTRFGDNCVCMMQGYHAHTPCAVLPTPNANPILELESAGDTLTLATLDSEVLLTIKRLHSRCVLTHSELMRYIQSSGLLASQLLQAATLLPTLQVQQSPGTAHATGCSDDMAYIGGLPEGVLVNLSAPIFAGNVRTRRAGVPFTQMALNAMLL
jgi:hypothetical protein